MAKPVLAGVTASLARRSDNTLNSLDLAIPPVVDAGIHWWTGLPLLANGFHDLQAIVLGPGKYENGARFIYVDSVDGVDNPDTKYYTKLDAEWDAVIGPDPFHPVGTPSAHKTLASAKKWGRSTDGVSRQNIGDVMMCKRGGIYGSTTKLDGWSDTPPNGKETVGDNPDPARANTACGASVDEPMIFTAYGTGTRPIMRRGIEFGFHVDIVTNYFFAAHLIFDD
jgi:hypothetical protein